MPQENLKTLVPYRFIVPADHPSADDRFILTRIDLEAGEANFYYISGPSAGASGTCTDLDLFWDAEEAEAA